MFKWLKKEIIIGIFFGLLYLGIELLYRGHTHWTMFLLGGLVSILIGLINEITPKMNIFVQMFIGTLIITFLELVFGYILNIKLGLCIWDYSNVPFNFLGQICLPFSFIWFILSYPIILLDDILKKYLKFNIKLK